MKTGRPALTVKKQASIQELKKHYQASTCAVERRRTQVIWWLSEGRSRSEVRKLSAYSNASIVEIVKRYNESGLEGLADQRHENPGAPALLSDAEILRLAQVVRKDYAKGVVWNGNKVTAWLKDELGKAVYPQRAYEYLSAIAMSQQVPRPRHRKADEVAQETFKKNSLKSSKKHSIFTLK
jgi:transposase